MCILLPGEAIKEFMANYRLLFPDASVTPKMHLLEEHTVDWMRRWHTGCGLMGEQGAESIHAHLRKLEEKSGVSNKLQKLFYVVKEHNLKASPIHTTPTQKKKNHGGLKYTLNTLKTMQYEYMYLIGYH